MYWKTLLETVLNKKILPSLKTTGEFLYFLAKRAKNDTIFRVAASLSYTSLIAIVPLLAIGLAIFSAFPVFSSARVQIEEFLMQNFIPSIEQEISQYLAEFVNAAAQLTTIGVVGLAITAILLLSTIENSLNFIFKVTRPRRFTTKITLYWTVITLGPLLLGATFSLRGYLFTLQKFMPHEMETGNIILSNLLPTFINMVLLMLVYVLVPNKKVRIKNAFIGSLIAVILFWVLRKSFGILVIENATYKTLYGALAALPVFLIWMYLAWSVVIFGAVVTASLEEFQGRDEKPLENNMIREKQIYYPRKKYKYAKKHLQKEQK